MRWQNLSLDEEERARLPGYRDDAVVRRFDAPDALETNFYEVRAKSILNRVPAASQVPFRWTINPYRGCSHACVYCTSPDTAVLMADGRTKAIADLDLGEKIYGTVRRDNYRHFTITEVLAKWSSIKPAYVVELEDGTELVASAEHRFLTRRGWKHVIGSEQGRLRRPHLTIGSRLLGPGGFAAGPKQDGDYRRGYLSGLIRGDGNLGGYSYHRPHRLRETVYRFRLALADREALDRAHTFLAQESIATDQFVFSRAAGTHRKVEAIRTQSRANVERISDLIAWPILPTLEWIKGFLAGMFDAEGSCSDGALRISNTDPELISWIVMCLRRLAFDCVVETPKRQRSINVVRLRGGLPERMRFFATTDPAISRKRSIDGCALKTDAQLRVVRIRSLDMVLRMYDITTGTGDFIANGVVSHNCFARPTHKYLDFNAGRDFERQIVVKVNAPELVRAELARSSWKGEHVALGTNTDPYQWVEGRYKLMPGIWEAMRDAANPCSILTKSPLLLRDIELVRQIAAVTTFSAAVSVPTLDEKAWRATEPHTPNPRARLEAVAELTRAGIRTAVLIAPLMPGVNDRPEQVEPILEMAAEAGVSHVTGIALHLRGEVRDLFFDWLAAHRPDLVPRYQQLYRNGAYAPAAERKRLAALVSGPDETAAQRMRRTAGNAFGHRGQPLELGKRAAAEPAERAAQERLF